jgi:branched-chain amino acid transport system substrate-binding protein
MQEDKPTQEASTQPGGEPQISPHISAGPMGNPMGKRMLLIGCAVVVLIGLVAAAWLLWPNKKAETKKPVVHRTIKLGLMVPLTADNSNFGVLAQQGLSMAKKDFNEEGLTFEIIERDTQCKADLAKTAAQELIDQGVVVIVGEVCSSASLAALDVANQNKTFLFSPASSSPKLSIPNDFFFRTYPTDKPQAVYAAALMKKNNIKKVATIYSNEPYGIPLNADFKAEFAKTGGTIVAEESFDTNVSNIDFSQQLTRIKAANPDALFLMTNSKISSAAILVQAKQMGLTAKLYGSDSLKDLGFVADVGDAGEGMTILAVTEGNQSFIDKYRAVYGKAPASAVGAQAYDVFMAVARAVKDGAVTGEQIRDAVAKMEFNGASGKIKFDANGDVIGADYKLYVIKNKNFQLLSQ